ncbi:hypothetical protein GCM10009631_12390 [Corynebacterium glaucum]
MPGQAAERAQEPEPVRVLEPAQVPVLVQVREQAPEPEEPEAQAGGTG